MGSSLAADFDAAAARLLAEVMQVGSVEAPFPLRLEAALDAALGLMDADPLLARRLTVRVEGDAELATRVRSWVRTYAQVLREAVEADPRYRAPRPSLEPEIIEGLAEQVRHALDAEVPALRHLLPRLYSFVFSYYREAGELQRYLNAFATD